MDLIAWWKDHGTKILGTLVAVLAGALAVGLVPPAFQTFVESLVALLGGTTASHGFVKKAAATPVV